MGTETCRRLYRNVRADRLIDAPSRGIGYNGVVLGHLASPVFFQKLVSSLVPRLYCDKGLE